MRTFTSFFRISILALVMMLSAGPLIAQPNTTRPSTNIVDRDINTVRTERDRERDNWGWIGLLGLLGLAGLLPRKKCTTDYDRSDYRNDNRGDPGNRPLNR